MYRRVFSTIDTRIAFQKPAFFADLPEVEDLTDPIYRGFTCFP